MICFTAGFVKGGVLLEGNPINVAAAKFYGKDSIKLR